MKLLTIDLINYVMTMVAVSASIPLRLDNFSIESCFWNIGSRRAFIFMFFLMDDMLLSFKKYEDGIKVYFSYSNSSLSSTKCPNIGTSQVTVLF